MVDIVVCVIACGVDYMFCFVFIYMLYRSICVLFV